MHWSKEYVGRDKVSLGYNSWMWFAPTMELWNFLLHFQAEVSRCWLGETCLLFAVCRSMFVQLLFYFPEAHLCNFIFVNLEFQSVSSQCICWCQKNREIFASSAVNILSYLWEIFNVYIAACFLHFFLLWRIEETYSRRVSCCADTCKLPSYTLPRRMKVEAWISDTSIFFVTFLTVWKVSKIKWNMVFEVLNSLCFWHGMTLVCQIRIAAQGYVLVNTYKAWTRPVAKLLKALIL